MARTLNATLAAAQIATERKPLVEVLSDKFVPDIPFTGQRLADDFPHGGYDGDTTDELAVNALALSDGRLAVLTSFGDRVWGYVNPNVRLTLTNPERTEFTDYSIATSGGAIVEMPDGNLGVMSNSGYWKIINVTTAPGTVMQSGHYGTYGWPPQNFGRGTSLIRLANGTYMTVYVSSEGSSPSYGDIALMISTSADFTTWSTPAEISMPFLDATHAKYSPFLFQTDDGTLNLLFEYVEQFTGDFGTSEQANIYHFVSADNGATWASAPGAGTFGAITNYPTFAETPRHPYAIPLGAGNWRISYHEAMSGLHMNTTAVGWEGNDHVLGIHFDEVSRLAYVVNYEPNDYGNLSSIVIVNPDTWSVVKSIDPTSGPTFGDMWFENGGGIYGSIRLTETIGERELVVIRKGNHIGVYNAETDQVTEFHFDAWEAHGVVVNTTEKPTGLGSSIGAPTFVMNIAQMYLDYDNRVLYLYWQYPYYFGGVLAVGKIDLTQTGPEYTHDIVFKKDALPLGSDPGQMPTEAQMAAISGSGDLKVYPDENLIVISGGYTTNYEGLGWPSTGVTILYAMDGSLIHFFDPAISDTYPYRGIQKFVKVGSDLWGYFLYEPNYGNEGRRGLARINLLDFSVSYYRPTFSFVDDYKFNGIIATQDGDEIILGNDEYGASAFVIADATWDPFNNARYPGLYPNEPQAAESLAYDAANEFVFLGMYASGSGGYLAYFYRHGFMTQPHHLIAVDGDPNWEYGEHSPLLTPRTDKDLVMTTDPASSGGMYAFWLHVNADGSIRVRWDKDLAEFDLTDYLVGGSAVTIKRSIDGTPNKLSFSVTHGHLFDPHNVDSLWSPVLKKYRRIRVRFGEEVAGVQYWTEAGTFVVISTKLSHERGSYPNMAVECEDIRIWWEDAEIVTTEHYEMTPENILADVISTWGGMAAEDVVIPAMEGSYVVWFQWLDTTVKKVVDALVGRFGYFPTITADNKFTIRKISNANAVDHTYSGTAMLISFTPDDDFSDFTNRVTVVGESRDFIDVLYEEEAVGTLYGTSGWWGNKQTFDVWFSEDHKRKAKNPRLKIIESCIPNSFIQYLGGGREGIVYIDADEFFCRIEVVTPDMSTVAWTTGAAVLVLGIAIGVTGSMTPAASPAAFAMFIGWVVLLSMLLYILSGIVNWQYEVWARPWGQQRIGCSGQANDVDLQALLNRINEKKLDEPLCISSEQCQWLAEHELMIVMMQRNRVRFDKIAHLQDEEGDTIVVPHPYSGKNMTVFITDLTRSFQIPSGDGGEGGFLDSITGWKIWPL
jgi:hypothetical protein